MYEYPYEVDGVRTRVLEAGDGGPPVVFVHGTGARADRWARNLDAVAARGRHVYAIDLPGHGFAHKGPGFDYTVPGYAEFLGRFLAQREIIDPVLVGTSLGGHVVGRYATSGTATVRGTVLVGSMGLVAVGEEARARVSAGANNQTRAGVEAKMHRVIHDPAQVTAEMLAAEYAVNNSPGAAESFRALGDYIEYSLDDDVVGEAIDGAPGRFPVLLVWGADDVTVPVTVGEAARKRIARAKLVMINGAAHTVYFERPDVFNRVLGDFVADLDVQASYDGARVA